MTTETENNAILRAKADLADCDRKIEITKAEEERLAADRQRWEDERKRLSLFIEMYQRYANEALHESVADNSVELVQTQGVKPNGADHADGNGQADNESPRRAKRRRPAVHRKPAGTPTTNEMIRTALRDAKARGVIGLAPKDIASFIRQKWWPHLKSSSVGPAAWRMHRDEQLGKEGNIYVLPAS
jgi:hypothetical protein